VQKTIYTLIAVVSMLVGATGVYQYEEWIHAKQLAQIQADARKNSIRIEVLQTVPFTHVIDAASWQASDGQHSDTLELPPSEFERVKFTYNGKDMTSFCTAPGLTTIRVKQSGNFSKLHLQEIVSKKHIAD